MSVKSKTAGEKQERQHRWQDDYNHSGDITPLMVLPGFNVHIMPGYLPTLTALPDGWIHAVHRSTATKHLFYLRTTGHVAAELRATPAPMPGFSDDRHHPHMAPSNRQPNPPIDIDYIQQLTLATFVELAVNYELVSCTIVNTSKQIDEFQGFEYPLEFSNGITLYNRTVLRAEEVPVNVVPFAEGQVVFMHGETTKSERLSLWAKLPLPIDADMQCVSNERLVEYYRHALDRLQRPLSIVSLSYHVPYGRGNNII